MRMLKLLPLIGLLALGACKDEKKAEKTGGAASPTATTSRSSQPNGGSISGREDWHKLGARRQPVHG